MSFIQSDTDSLVISDVEKFDNEMEELVAEDDFNMNRTQILEEDKKSWRRVYETIHSLDWIWLCFCEIQSFNTHIWIPNQVSLQQI